MGRSLLVRLRLMCDTVASLDARHSCETAEVIPSPTTWAAVLCREYPGLGVSHPIEAPCVSAFGIWFTWWQLACSWGVLGGQLGINDTPSGDDVPQLRGDGGSRRGVSVRYGEPEPGSVGVLPVPAGATPWPTNTNALLNRTAFVELAYSKKDWAAEEGEEASRGFVAAVQQGWGWADGSQQSITLVRFAGLHGPTSACKISGKLGASTRKARRFILEMYC